MSIIFKPAVDSIDSMSHYSIKTSVLTISVFFVDFLLFD